MNYTVVPVGDKMEQPFSMKDLQLQNGTEKVEKLFCTIWWKILPGFLTQMESVQSFKSAVQGQYVTNTLANIFRRKQVKSLFMNELNTFTYHCQWFLK